MKFDALSTAVSLATFIAVANAQTTAAPWGQCGGQGWTGPTVCATGWTCVYSNPWYSQCLQGTATSTSTSTSTTSRTTTTTTTTRTTSTTSTPTSVPTGFVKTSGQKFTLNGSTFFHVGTNAYFLAQFDDAKITQAFSEMKAAGYTVVRTWGFNDVTATQTYGAYYQLWTNGVPTINYGPYGLDRFDYVVKAANAAGVKLVVPLVNNWKDYGGMDAYINALNPGGTHDSFYTNTAIINAYKNYIKAFVGRYVNEPAILGWELGNEPRCGGSSGSPSSACNSTMLYNWASTISAYIKSIDKNHLVAIGDEGWINSASPPSYPYQGNSIGIDFDKNLGISTIDWGTFHLYPESWGQSANITGFGSQWIKDHATFQKSKNKPVVIEEYGVTSSSDVVYKQWLADIVSSGVTGALFWQQAVKFADGTTTWDDGYGVYPTSPAYPVIVAGHNAIKARG